MYGGKVKLDSEVLAPMLEAVHFKPPEDWSGDSKSVSELKENFKRVDEGTNNIRVVGESIVRSLLCALPSTIQGVEIELSAKPLS